MNLVESIKIGEKMEQPPHHNAEKSTDGKDIGSEDSLKEWGRSKNSES